MSHMREALYYTVRENGKLICDLCPHSCAIADGKSGRCRVRVRQKDRLLLPYYGMISSISVDPIEKKPLYHFYPGSQILSVGFWGCNFHCPFCQNYSISQNIASVSDFLSPSDLVNLAKNRGSFGIAYTYSEPLIHFEYLLDCAKLVREAGMKNVLVSNGFLSEAPANELLEFLDAANIDLKSFDPGFYRTEIGGTLEGVRRFIALAAGRIALEVTTLVIPGKNDSPPEIEQMARFLADLDRNIPYHLSCYYPTYKYSIDATPPQTVADLSQVARRHLSFVYEGNVGLRETNTVCPSCGSILIRRRG
ncbi:MAG: AmmeMemoRadiSam system radical SAM enzyme, partial [Chitinispirillaceae bacterium]|nr:AmmeMemoRadiSam system radical SAM enzyme [Chitinispirillaceae bacterium]